MKEMKIQAITNEATAITKSTDARITLPNGIQFHIILRGENEIQINKHCLKEDYTSMSITPVGGNSIKIS